MRGRFDRPCVVAPLSGESLLPRGLPHRRGTAAKEGVSQRAKHPATKSPDAFPVESFSRFADMRVTPPLSPSPHVGRRDGLCSSVWGTEVATFALLRVLKADRPSAIRAAVEDHRNSGDFVTPVIRARGRVRSQARRFRQKRQSVAPSGQQLDHLRQALCCPSR